MKALYHATCMMRTGSRRTIVYLNSRDECTEYINCFQRVIEDYHGVDDIWLGNVTSDVDAQQWSTMLSQFQGGCEGSFCVLTSVRTKQLMFLVVTQFLSHMWVRIPVTFAFSSACKGPEQLIQ